jgi:hypothetical protein
MRRVRRFYEAVLSVGYLCALAWALREESDV